MIYAIYLRKSRADLEAEAMGQGETLARHRAALREYAQSHGMEIGAVYEEIVSGESIDARPKMKQLLREVEQGRWAGVLCMDIDRLARGDSADQARVSNTFRISGTLIITPSKVYDQSRESDEEYVDFELFMARREYKAISRRIMRGRIASVKEGHFIGSTPPYGYDKVKVERGRGFTLSPNSESDTVKQIYSMCISGMGCNAIARRLDMMGIEPRKGKSWTHRRDNPECIIAQGLHPALISEEEFDRAQQYLDSRRIPHARENTQLRNPLSGLVYCGMCGSMMTRLGTGSRNHSDTLRCPNRNCGNVSAKLELVESALAEGVARWLNDCRVNVSRKHAADTAKAERTAADKVRAELTKLDSHRERIYSLLEQGVYSAGEFRERMEALEKRRAQLSENLRQAEQAVSEAEGNRQLYAQIIPRVERVMDIYAQSTPEEKNHLLKTIISRAEYIKTERNTRENADRGNFTLNVIPLFPEIKTGAE